MNLNSPEEKLTTRFLPDSLKIVIHARGRDLVGGFKVQRLLPFSQRKIVGPIIFLVQICVCA